MVMLLMTTTLAMVMIVMVIKSTTREYTRKQEIPSTTCQLNMMRITSCQLRVTGTLDSQTGSLADGHQIEMISSTMIRSINYLHTIGSVTTTCK
jgi:hypothetical protein